MSELIHSAPESEAAPAVARAAANLKKWREEIVRLKELSSLQIAMLAREGERGATGEISPSRHLFATLFEAKEFDPALHRELCTERLDFCRAWQREQKGTADTAVMLAEMRHRDTARIACLDSPLFGEAHTQFSALLPSTEPHPCATFSEVLEEVVAGNAHFGVLPIENARDGKLFRFYEQIERHELHIFATKSATLGEGEEPTRIALISKAPPPLPRDAEKVVECVVFEEDAFSLSDILFVAASCGITLRRIDSLPASFGRGHFLHHPIFHTVSGDLQLFNTYLDFFMPRTIITACYLNLKG